MADPPELQHNAHWRTAVWALRVGYGALAVALTGVIVWATGSTPWLLAVGVVIWLIVVVVTLTAFLLARHELSAPRPGLWSMRMQLIGDSIHSRSSVPPS